MHLKSHPHPRILASIDSRAMANAVNTWKIDGTDAGLLLKGKANLVHKTAQYLLRVPQESAVQDSSSLSRGVEATVPSGRIPMGRNTESFDATTTLSRPDMRVCVGDPHAQHFGSRVKHDDIIIVPGFYCNENDLSVYEKINAEITDWKPWHGNCHYISEEPHLSPTFNDVVERVCSYFRLTSPVCRLNYYKNNSSWKPFHHDMAAYSPESVANISVGISFGCERELAFLDTASSRRIYFPHRNGMAISFGRDVNIRFKHGVNYQSTAGTGRFSIWIWGHVEAIEEPNSPARLLKALAQRPRSRSRSINQRAEQTRRAERTDDQLRRLTASSLSSCQRCRESITPGQQICKRDIEIQWYHSDCRHVRCTRPPALYKS
jgi:hypothetical protein